MNRRSFIRVSLDRQLGNAVITKLMKPRPKRKAAPEGSRNKRANHHDASQPATAVAASATSDSSRGRSCTHNIRTRQLIAKATQAQTRATAVAASRQPQPATAVAASATSDSCRGKSSTPNTRTPQLIFRAILAQKRATAVAASCQPQPAIVVAASDEDAVKKTRNFILFE